MSTYGRGTWEEYLADDLQTKTSENWTEEEIANGKINYYHGEKAPNHQRTLYILNYIQNPNDSNDYVWESGDELTEEDYLSLLNEWGIND